MREQFISNLRAVFSEHNFTETTLVDNLLFVYETAGIDFLGYAKIFTVMTTIAPEIRNFEIINTIAENQITHICIDRDFIPYGQQKYDVNNIARKDGRPDFVVFDDNNFLFVELKLNQEDATFNKEDTKWSKFFEGANQILDFVNFLRGNGFEIKDYCSKVCGIVAMRFEPNFSIKTRGNSARNSTIFKISQKLGFKIIAQNYFEF